MTFCNSLQGWLRITGAGVSYDPGFPAGARICTPPSTLDDSRFPINLHVRNPSLPSTSNYYELPAPIRGRLSGHGRGNGERGVHKLRNGPSPIRHADGLRWPSDSERQYWREGN
jgi:hypothetical protein